MKVASRHQIYLDYLLPRDNSWSNLSLRIDTDAGFQATLRPRGPAEELFPEDIDRTLSSMTFTLRPLAVVDGQIDVRVADRALDRIEVTILTEVEEECDWTEETRRATRRAVDMTDGFLAHCRVAADSPFVAAVPRAWRSQDTRFYVMAPNTITWYDGETGDRLPVLDGVNALAESGAIRAPETGAISAEAILRSLRRGQDPPIFRSLLVDAQANVNNAELREAVLALASALEVASNVHLNRSGKRGTPAVEAILKRSGISFAERRFDQLAQILEGRSLKLDAPQTYSDVEIAYRERNDLMHSGEFGAELSSLKGEDKPRRVQELIASGRHAITWLGV